MATTTITIAKGEPKMYQGKPKTNNYGLPQYTIYDSNGGKHTTTDRALITMVGQTVEVDQTTGETNGYPWSSIKLIGAKPTMEAINQAMFPEKRAIQPVDVNAALARSIEFVTRFPDFEEGDEAIEKVKFYTREFLEFQSKLLEDINSA